MLPDHTTHERRPFLRFFVCNEDASCDLLDAPLNETMATGAEPFMIVGAIARG
jgi:molybdopterin synthase sulfur carrier subunit